MSDNQDLLEIYKQFHASQDKYTYFLLAAAAAAIGFVVQKSDGSVLTWWLLPAGFSVICWCVSFYYGCRYIELLQSCFSANYEFRLLQIGNHPEQPSNPLFIEAALNGTQSGMQRLANTASNAGKYQFRWLVCGAALFLLWRISELVKLTFFAQNV